MSLHSATPSLHVVIPRHIIRRHPHLPPLGARRSQQQETLAAAAAVTPAAAEVSLSEWLTARGLDIYTDALQNLGGDSVNDLRFLTQDDLKGVRTRKHTTHNMDEQRRDRKRALFRYQILLTCH